MCASLSHVPPKKVHVPLIEGPLCLCFSHLSFYFVPLMAYPSLVCHIGTKSPLTSPNYPFNYPPSASCLWKISLNRPSTSYAVQLTFNSFYLESSSNCSDDYVEIRDGYTFSTSTFIGKFCGTRIPPVIVSRYSYIFVKFISDSDYYSSLRYFSASFKAILSGKFTTTSEKINVTNCNVSGDNFNRRCSQQ